MMVLDIIYKLIMKGNHFKSLVSDSSLLSKSSLICMNNCISIKCTSEVKLKATYLCTYAFIQLTDQLNLKKIYVLLLLIYIQLINIY